MNHEKYNNDKIKVAYPSWVPTNSSSRTIYARRPRSVSAAPRKDRPNDAEPGIEKSFQKSIVLGKVWLETVQDFRVGERKDSGKNVHGLDESDGVTARLVAGGLSNLEHVGKYGAGDR